MEVRNEREGLNKALQKADEKVEELKSELDEYRQKLEQITGKFEIQN